MTTNQEIYYDLRAYFKRTPRRLAAIRPSGDRLSISETRAEANGMRAYTVRDRLYTAEELLSGFDPDDSSGFLATWDFRQFQQYKRDGGPAPKSIEVRMAQARHDAEMSHALMEHLRVERPLVGIMGGHKLARNEAAYRAVAALAHRLTNEGFLVATGGGPGAMEAAHVGAACATVEVARIDVVIAELRKAAVLPKLGDIVDSSGEIVAPPELLQQAQQWLAAAVRARSLLPSEIGPSLAVPTWLYGQEPTMPFATAYAKYFQNSIREEALVKHSAAGIVYARGGGGTLREIFQDLEENYYARSTDLFTPMIFFDPDQYWERDAAEGRPGIKIDQLLQKVVTFARPDDAAQCLEKVLFSTDLDSVVAVLTPQVPVAQHAMRLIIGGRGGSIPIAAWSH